MDTDFLDLLEQAFLDEQIDGATMDSAYLLMQSTPGSGQYFLRDYSEASNLECQVH